MQVSGTEILRVEVGSTLHGIGVGSDDTDLMGITIEPASAVFGLDKFEQVTHRTAPEGVRSGPDDVDLVVYGLRKWMSLAVKGNPSTIVLLYAPEEFTRHVTALGSELRDLAVAIVSQRCKGRFLGYLNGQRKRAVEDRSSGRGRREGREEKWASHMVRLGYQGREILSTGRLTLPMPEDQASYCRAIKRGVVPFEEALATSHALEQDIESIVSSPLAAAPDIDRIESWMRSAYMRTYGASLAA